jgi:hypothetical protein
MDIPRCLTWSLLISRPWMADAQIYPGMPKLKSFFFVWIYSLNIPQLGWQQSPFPSLPL